MSQKLSMSQKVANASKEKVMSNTSHRFGEVLELEDDTNAFDFEEIYDEVGMQSRLPIFKQEKDYKIKRVKQCQESRIKSLEKKIEEDHLLTCLAEECGEVMEVMFLEPDNKEKIEFELNDIIGVAHLLHDKDIICADLDKPEVPLSSVSNKDIYTCIKDIQYFTHKSIRFGLLNFKPNSTKRNIDELTKLLQKLTLLIYSSKDYEIYENFDAKKEKILRFMRKQSKQ